MGAKKAPEANKTIAVTISATIFIFCPPLGDYKHLERLFLTIGLLALTGCQRS